MAIYFLKAQEEERGPFTKSQVRSMWNNGTITANTLFREENSEIWKSLSDEFLDSAESTNNVPGVETTADAKPKNVSVLWLFLILGVAAILFFGNFHIITGGSSGPKIVERDSFGFSEIFINVEAITGMPWISARSRFPIGCRVLSREGIIESDEAFRKRIEEDSKQQWDKAMKDAQQEMEKTLRDLQR